MAINGYKWGDHSINGVTYCLVTEPSVFWPHIATCVHYTRVMAPCRTTPPLQFTAAYMESIQNFASGTRWSFSRWSTQVSSGSVSLSVIKANSSTKGSSYALGIGGPELDAGFLRMPPSLVLWSLKRHFRWNLERFRCQGGRHPHRVSQPLGLHFCKAVDGEEWSSLNGGQHGHPSHLHHGELRGYGSKANGTRLGAARGSLIHRLTNSLFHWFMNSLIHSVSSAWILSCHFIRRWCTSQLHNLNSSFLLQRQNFPIGNWFLIAVSFFQNFRPSMGQALSGT